MSWLGELVLSKLCQPLPPETNPWIPRTSAEQLAGFSGKFDRPITDYFTGHTLEIGSGNGILAEGLRDSGADRLTVTDYWSEFPTMINKCVRDRTGLELVRTDAGRLPFADRLFDTVISEDGFEHFLFPARVLAEVFRVLKTGGTFLITFGPPWYSPRGGHMMFLNAPPWFHLIFSEKTVFDVRARYRSDGVRRWSEGYSPTNKMSIGDFRRQARGVGLQLQSEIFWAVGGRKALTRLPYLREFFCNLYAGVWRK